MSGSWTTDVASLQESCAKMHKEIERLQALVDTDIEALQDVYDVIARSNDQLKRQNRRLRAALADAEQRILDLKQKYCPYPHRGDWCFCGWSRPTDTSND